MKNTVMTYKRSSETSMFDQEFTLASLTAMGNPLPGLKEALDFEPFRPVLEPVLAKEDRKGNAGRKPIDPVFMMRVCVLQRLYGLSDKQAEYQIKDRMSFREFLGIRSVDDVLDEKTIWAYRSSTSAWGRWA